MTYKHIIAAGLAFAAFTATPAAAEPSRPARLGQTVRVDGPRVQPLRVIEDSRCPANARCIRAGEVVLQARVYTGRRARIVNLTLGRPAQVADGQLTLVSVTPERWTNRPIRASDYRFAFEFAGGL